MKNKKLIINLKNYVGFKIKKILKNKIIIGKLYSQMNGHAGIIV